MERILGGWVGNCQVEVWRYWCGIGERGMIVGGEERRWRDVWWRLED